MGIKGVSVVASGIAMFMFTAGQPAVGGAPPGRDVQVGTDGSDVMRGGPGPDELRGLGGLDTLAGRGGNDTLLLGPGDGGETKIHEDAVGQDGDDLVSGGPGPDTVEGGRGDDEVLGGKGSDMMQDNSGNDVISGGRGPEYIIVGAGKDHVFGGPGADRIELRHDEDRDVIDCGSGQDLLVWLYNFDAADRYTDCESVYIVAQ